MQPRIELWHDQNTTIEYMKAMSIMDKMHAKIVKNREKKEDAAGIIWLLEHDHVYTTGSTTSSGDVFNPKAPVHQTTRGGRATYHGPGQRVIYIIIDLKKLYHPFAPDIRNFVLRLENLVVTTLQKMGIDSFLLPEYPGVWCDIGNNNLAKIAAIGLRVRNWITYHGIAINIKPNMDYFNYIVPCGIREHGVTSVAQIIEEDCSTDYTNAKKNNPTDIMSCFDQFLLESVPALGMKIDTINFNSGSF